MMPRQRRHTVRVDRVDGRPGQHYDHGGRMDRTRGGQGRQVEPVPWQTTAILGTLPDAARDARQAILERRLPRSATVAMHEARPPYGVRNGRAICPRCYAENAPGRFDAATGTCQRRDGRPCRPMRDDGGDDDHDDDPVPTGRLPAIPRTEGDRPMTHAHQTGRGPIIAPDVRADILATMGTERDVVTARRLGVKATAVNKIRRVDGDPETRTIRDMIMRLLAANGPYANAEALLRDIRIADTAHRWHALDLHNLQHQLGAMNRIALVAYRRRRVGSITRLTDIRGRTTRTNGAAAEPAVVAAEPPPDVVAPPVAPWPVLDELRRKVADRMSRIAALEDAADALTGVDADASGLLRDRATEIAAAMDLTPAEAEYLRFADDHDGGAA